MTTDIIAWVNYPGLGKKSLFTFQNRRGEDIRERTVSQINADELGVQPIEYDMRKTVKDTENLDVVNDVTGVDSPYEE